MTAAVDHMEALARLRAALDASGLGLPGDRRVRGPLKMREVALQHVLDSLRRAARLTGWQPIERPRAYTAQALHRRRVIREAVSQEAQRQYLDRLRAADRVEEHGLIAHHEGSSVGCGDCREPRPAESRDAPPGGADGEAVLS